ncbi:MAG: hypothetical protein M0Z48_13255 [Nitrospiraceae bacterium]|nr:hypothetical protein [Nitrospiraceae bacterium]
MAENSSKSEISRYLAVIREKRYVALAVGLAVLSAIVWGGFLWPKTYRADSTVFVQKGLLMQPFMKNSGVSATLEDELRILKNSMTSRSILSRVLKHLDMDVTAKNARQYEALIKKVREDLDVTVKEGRRESIDLFTISFASGNPAESRDFVNALVNEYIEESIADRRNSALGAYTFLSGQMDGYRKKLDETDQKIRGFMQAHPNMMLQGASASASRIGALQSAEVDAEIKLKELMDKRNELAMELSGKKKLVAGLGAKDGSFQSRLDRLNDELIMLKTKYTDQYPEVIKTKAEIDSLKRQMQLAGSAPEAGQNAAINPVYQQLRDELAQTDSAISSAKIRLSAISGQQLAARRTIGSLPSEQAELSNLQNDRDAEQKIYDNLAQELESARVSKDLQMSDYSSMLRVVDPAVLPFIPEKPDMVKMIALGLFLGLFSGVGAAIGLDYLNNSYRDEEAVETGLRIPVLISIPRMATEEDKRISMKKDLKVFGAAGIYVLMICALLVREFMFRYMGIRVFPF